MEQLARQHAALERATAVQNGQPSSHSIGKRNVGNNAIL